MILLILGLILWIGAHFFKRLAPDARTKMGNKGRGPIALSILAGVVLMVLGYRAAEFTSVYTPVPGIGHLNNLLMLVAVFFFGIGSAKGVLVDKVRHPMLTGMVIFAFAHLLVNGDLASIILFGGLGLWAIVQMLLINSGDGAWERPAPGTLKGDIKNAIITLVIYVVVTGLHVFLGHNPFMGSYA
ncbi:NnrU family protein [uncultured Roseovarius sp.]|uniref:NnrU family protein n=1 Tax=uncultured Roseovarius sp. TaxID=293344 RepID=UPI0026202284|nr:NnrU family protein [uncultured Roseovarius sp.]